MSITVHINADFANPDEAFRFLSRIGQVAQSEAVSVEGVSASQPAWKSQQSTGGAKKASKSKPKASKPAEPAEAEAEDVEAADPADSSDAAPKPSTEGLSEPGEQVSDKELREVTGRVSATIGMNEVTRILNKYGVERLSHLDEAQRREVVSHCRRLLEDAAE